MSITLPEGWTNFSGGGTVEVCAEVPQDSDQTNNEIPVITLKTLGADGLAIEATLFCEPATDFNISNKVIFLRAEGGIPPFFWTTGEGTIVATGPRTAKLTIAGGIEFFQPFVQYLYSIHDNPLQQLCDPAFGNSDAAHRILSNSIAQAYVIGYDCAGHPIGPSHLLPGQPFQSPSYQTGGNFYNLTVGYPSFFDPFPIGPAVGRNSSVNHSGDCIGAPVSGCIPGGVSNLWLGEIDCCCADSSGFENLSLSVSCKTANTLCYNGVVNPSAPNFSEIFNLTILDFNPPGSPQAGIVLGVDHAFNFIDVRTPEMLPGHEILVTATEYGDGATALITVTT